MRRDKAQGERMFANKSFSSLPPKKTPHTSRTTSAGSTSAARRAG